jgi:hypothetical protein
MVSSYYRCTTIHHILRAPRRIVGQVFNLRRIVNPPAALVRARRHLGESPPLVAARRYVGQDGILRGGWQPPPFLYFAKVGSILKQAGLK